MNAQLLLAALAEPSRLRIVELLAESPHAVGEIAHLLGARQPQTTKHLQTLETAGVITIHRLGKRRIAALRREALRELSEWLGGLSVAHPSESVLGDYERTIGLEESLLETDSVQLSRVFEIHRTFSASPPLVWQAWTTRELIRQWWSPEHFEVVACEFEPVTGGKVRIEIQEGDGARYSSTGVVLTLLPTYQLDFTLAPIGAGETPLFDAVHRVTFDDQDGDTALSMSITVSNITETAAPALAGIPFGWEQCFNKLARVLSEPAEHEAQGKNRRSLLDPRQAFDQPDR